MEFWMELVLVCVAGGGVVVVLLGLPIVPALRRWKWQQFIREQGPETHRSKSGTPTMGGVIFLAPLLAGGMAAGLARPEIVALVALAAAYGLLGASDDLRKITGGQSLGLRAREKLLAQFLFAVAFSGWFLWHPGLEPVVLVPGVGWEWQLGWWFLPFALLVVVGTTNTVNLTDGLDGLAAGTGALALFAQGFLAWGEGWGAIALVCWVMGGAALGFLWFNAHPALVFMGDTGAFLLGAVLAGAALLSGTALWLPILGGIFVIEGLSVMAQVVVYRRTGRRLLRMSPLHHHFELLGWPESRVVTRFWLLGVLLAATGLWLG